MKILVTVKARAKKTYVKQTEKNTYVVSVHEPPVEGKANDAVLKALAEFFRISPSQIFMVSGQTSKQKIFEVL